MSKELEALDRIIKFFNNDFPIKNYSIDDARKDLDNIDTSLKEHEWFENTLKDFGVEKNQLRTALLLYKNFPDYEKELKALEIIKERPLLALVDYNYTYEEWLALLEEDETNPFKSQQEYDLLKEVLL